MPNASIKDAEKQVGPFPYGYTRLHGPSAPYINPSDHVTLVPML